MLGVLVAAFVLAMSSHAVGAPANVGPAASASNATVSVPIVDLVDELPVIQAYINGKGPFRFKFDSWSTERIDAATASALGLSISGHADISEIAGPVPSAISSVDLQIVGGKPLHTTIFVMQDGWHDSPTINGYLGTSFLDNYTVTLDIPHRRMILAPPGGYTPSAGSTVLPMSRIDDYGFAVPARIDGLYGTFIIDTGFRGHMLMSSEFQQSPDFKREYSSRGLAGQAAGPAGKQVPITVLWGRVLEIGDQQIANPMIALPERGDIALLHDVFGLIGLYSLQQFEITFDAADSRFVLSNRQPSTVVHRGTGFDTEYSSGVTWIRRVVRGSPAWEAGLRDGDRLLEVDHQPVDGISQTAWATLYQVTDGAVVHLVAQRGNSAPQPLDIVLKAWKEQF